MTARDRFRACMNERRLRHAALVREERIADLEAKLAEAEAKAVEIMALDEGENPEDLSGYARGSYFAARVILAKLKGESHE